MQPEILKEVLQRVKSDYGLQERGTYLRGGRCPACDKKELWTSAEKPWILRCGRENRCGETFPVKELYPDLFDDWSKRHKQNEQNPHAAADAYLQYARGFSLLGLRGAYTQERYHDQKLDIGTATVRFPLPGGGYWERLIDQPARFGKKKARFSYGHSYRGQWWQMPGVTMADLAAASAVWAVEGIFDAIALNQSAAFRDRGCIAVSLMSCNNYPEAALAELRRAAADTNRPTPPLIFAFDVGAAGVRYTRQFVKQAREAGWTCGAAQVRPDGDGEKLDWNDLAQRELLTADQLDLYLWNGDVTIAPDVREKALLIYNRERFASFPITFGQRQYWATFSAERIEEQIDRWTKNGCEDFPDFDELTFEEQWNRAARHGLSVEEIANCVFRTLYFQRDPNLEEGAYFLSVDFPSDRARVKSTFSGSACSTSGEFKKRLASVAPGAQWTGEQRHLDKLMQRQWATIRMVEAIQHTGYSIEHGAWIFGDLAVHKGRVHEPNDEDYFVLGKQSVKLRTSDRLLRIAYDPDKLDLSWVAPLKLAYGPKGIATLAFWCLSLFADQIRRKQDSLAFLELTGLPGTGKTTLLEFCWKLFGRANYEGFDPTKATNAGIARTLGQVGNLPVVLIEGDRNQDTPHSKRFEWDELKTAYNGRAVRTRAIANGGMETFEPPFRGAIVIAQNDSVEASPALRERIMAIHFDKGRFSAEGKRAGELLSRTEIEDVSGFIVHVVRREEAILKAYDAAFAEHEARMLRLPRIRNQRLAKNHAQLAAMLDAMRPIFGNAFSETELAEAHDFIEQMLHDRQLAVETDHPHVEWFWERVDHFKMVDGETPGATGIDHSRTGDVIAINLVQFEQRCSEKGLRAPCLPNELKRLLKSSKRRKFERIGSVNSRALEKTVQCWIFKNPDHPNR